ncbi:sulfotransferase [Candidatus Bipolaricaulota bacterium]|nr:sulfotransferase [Candidatus Bipolaricaulota bacterium]
MTRKARPSHAEHPIALGSFRSWMRLVRSCPSIDRIYIPRLLLVSLTTLLTSSLRFWDNARYGSAIRRTSIHPSPVFIVGHWRSGTTHLHNLLCQDKSFGYLSTFQAMAPGFCLMGDKRIKPALAMLARRRYPTRLIDNIPLAFDAPQEDEFALANMSSRAFIHAFSFPRQADDFFERYVLFHDLPEQARVQWSDTYLRLLRKITFASGGRRLAIKNCAHSGRIQTLLELFPDAKFIHIHRNPYEVFLSTVYMHKTVLPRSQLQDIDPDQVEANVLRFYKRLMGRFLIDKTHIPAGNLVEIRYEDLERSPLDQLRTIYEVLDLPGFDAAESAFSSYIDSIADYKRNTYKMDAAVIEKVNRHWAFALDEWGYHRLTQAPSQHGRSRSHE